MALPHDPLEWSDPWRERFYERLAMLTHDRGLPECEALPMAEAFTRHEERQEPERLAMLRRRGMADEVGEPALRAQGELWG